MPKPTPPMPSPSSIKARRYACSQQLVEALYNIQQITSSCVSMPARSNFLPHIAQCNSVATKALKLLEGESR